MTNRTLETQSYLASIPMLCSVEATGITKNQILDHWPQDSIQWNTWIHCVQLNCVETQVFTGLNRFALKVPASIHETLEKKNHHVRKQNTQRRLQFSHLLAEFDTHALPVLLLKGNAIAQEIYKDLDYKQMNDVDLLFKKESLDTLHRIFNKFPLITLGSLQNNFREQEKYSHHWPPFFDRNMAMFIGTHWNLITPLASIKIDPNDLWLRAKTFEYQNHLVCRLANEDFIHHLCLHLSAHKVGVKELADIYNCLGTWKDFDWILFWDIVSKANSEQRVYRALQLSQLLVFNAGVESFLQRLERNKKILNASSKEITQTKLLLSRTNYLSKIEKTYALFALTDDPFEKTKLLAKMWRLLLVPPLKDSLRLTFRTESPSFIDKCCARIIAPWKISKAFSQDLGWALFTLITLRHQWDLAKAWLSFFNDKNKTSWKDKAKALGLDPLKLNSASMLD